MQKVQASLLAVNVAVLALFMVGVAVIVHTEEPAVAAGSAIVRGERVGAIEAAVEAQELASEPDASVARVCETTGGCSERSVLAPILFAFLAGGIMNLPEVTALPCI
jgi:hypothetical protein